jgi:periplasmic protein TonB
MFDQTFVDNAQKTNEPVTFALSVVLEICGIGLLLLLPLIYTQALPSAQLKSLLMAPTSPSAPPKAPVEARKSPRAMTVHRLFTIVAPAAVPKAINKNIQEIQAAPDITVPGLDSTGRGATDLTGLPGQIYSVPQAPPPPPPQKAKAPAPVRVATGVAEANLIRKVMPIYPPLAKSARVQGTVEFTAIISKEGNIENLRLVRAHPLLVEAARQAVLQWRYRPTLLNGQPVEVVTDIVVNFTLTQ